MNLSRPVLLVTILSTAGCTTPPPSQRELAAADYGVFPLKYKAIIAAYMQANLRDPASAMYSEPKSPVMAYAGVRVRTYGWATCMGVNAKNGYGGYTGQNLYFFLFRDGKIAITERAGVGSSPFELEYVQGLCRRLI